MQTCSLGSGQRFWVSSTRQHQHPPGIRPSTCKRAKRLKAAADILPVVSMSAYDELLASHSTLDGVPTIDAAQFLSKV